MAEHIASTGKAELQRRAKVKTAILLRWATSAQGIPWKREGHAYLLDKKSRRCLEYFPTDPTAFAAWSSDMAFSSSVKEELSEIQTLSRTSFRQSYHDSARADAIAAMRAVEERAKKQMAAQSSLSVEAEQSAEIKRLNKIISIQERDINQLTEKTAELNSSVVHLNRVIEANDQVTLYEVQRLEARVAELTRVFHESQSLRLMQERNQDDE